MKLSAVTTEIDTQKSSCLYTSADASLSGQSKPDEKPECAATKLITKLVIKNGGKT